MAAKRPITDRLQAALAWLITGEDTSASELCGIPRETIRDWRSDSSWEEFMHQARKIRQAELEAKFTRIIHKAVDEVAERLEEGDVVVSKTGEPVRKKVSARDAAWIYAVTTDKRAVMRGEASSISKRTTDKDSLKDKKAELEKLGSQGLPDEPEEVDSKRLN
jgi:hypothetical protein